MSTDQSAAAPAFRFRFLPVLATVVLGIGIPYLAGEILFQLRHYSRLVPGIADQLGWQYAQHGLQMILALVAIAIVQRVVRADYGLHLPAGKSYVLPAILWGLSVGLLMTLIDHASDILTHTAPRLSYPLTTGNVLGWLGFHGLYVGPTEEILFRSLLVTYLCATMPGKVRFRGYDMNAAGLVVAAIYALYAAGFLSRSWPVALGEMLCQFLLGVLYAYWLEKSKSVLAPIVGHNVSDLTEYGLVFLMVAYWA
jgi:hypothetical protein